MERRGRKELPRELVEGILKRLTYKNLARFRSVCKNWYAILKDPVFLSAHTQYFLKHHTGSHNVLFRLSFPTLFGNGMESYKLYTLSAMEDDRSAVETFRPKFNMLSTKLRISGHCNGILCLCTAYWPRSLEVLLYNPATRQFKCLPDSEIRFNTRTLALTVGMGYDSVTDDYKVIRVWRVDGFANGGVPTTTNWVEEYALSTHSWVRLDNTNAGRFHFGKDSFALFFQRTYYWWALSLGDRSSVILEFNMEGRVFRTVPIPDQIDVNDTVGRSLAVWNNTISLVCCTCRRFIDIWMKDESQEGFWIQMRRLIHPGEEPKPLVFWKGNELLMEMSSGKMKSYDVDTEEIRDVKVKGHPIQYSSQAVNYEATTVSLGPGASYLL